MTALLNAVSRESNIYYGSDIILEAYMYSNNMTVRTTTLGPHAASLYTRPKKSFPIKLSVSYVIPTTRRGGEEQNSLFCGKRSHGR